MSESAETDCPSPQELLDLVEGSLTPPESARLRAHIDGCSLCLSAAAAVARESETGPTVYPTRYRILGEAGHGGQARVLRAFDTVTAREVALKELATGGGGDHSEPPGKDRAARFVREARITASLTHPTIVPVFDIGERADGRPFYTMQLVRGRTLAQALRECAGLAQRLRLLPHVVDVCNAVSFAHARDVVHRDLKPQNVVVGEYGQTFLLDWGLAKSARAAPDEPGSHDPSGESPETTRRGSVLGTPAYMSPEQAGGQPETVNERSDIFGLGAILYQLLTGRPPLDGSGVSEVLAAARSASIPAPQQLCRDVPRELATIASKALALDPAARYERAGDIARDLRAYQAGERVAVVDYSSWELLRRMVGRHRLAFAAGAVTLLSIVVSTVVLAVALRGTERERARAETLLVRADAMRERAEESERITLVERAEVAVRDRDFLGGRARVRTVLEEAEDASARAIWWRASTSALVWRTGPGSASHRPLDASPTEPTIAASTGEGGVRLFDLRTGESHRLEHPGATPMAVRYSPDGRRIAIAERSGRIHLCEPSRGTCTELPGPAGLSRSLAFSPDGRQLFAAVEDVGVLRWALGDVPPERTVVWSGPADAWSLAVHPDGRRIAFARNQRKVVELDLTSREERELDCPLRRARSLAYSPAGETLATTGGGKGVVCLFDATGAATVSSGLEVVTGGGTGVDFSPDGDLLVVGGGDGSLTIIERRTGRIRRVLREGSERLAFAPAWTADGHAVAAHFQDGSLKVIAVHAADVVSGSADPAPGGPRAVWGLAVSPDGNTIAAGGADGRLRFYAATTGELVRAFPVSEAAIMNVAFAPDGRQVATASMDGVIRVWDATRELPPVLVLHGAGGTPFWVGYSPDGRWLAASTADPMVRVWDRDTGGLVLKLLYRGRASWAHQGSRLAVVETRSNQLEIVEVGGKVRALGPCPVSVQRLEWLPGDKSLLVATVAGGLVRWDPFSGKVDAPWGTESVGAQLFVLDGAGAHIVSPDEGAIRVLDGAGGPPRVLSRRGADAAAFLPDGRRVAVSGAFGDVRVLDLDTGRSLWGGPLLRRTVDEVYTHAGWRTSSGASVAVAPRAWRTAVAERARLARESADGSTLCLVAGRSVEGVDSVELWNLEQDAQVGRVSLPGVSAIEATEDRCVVLADGKVLELRPGNEPVEVSGDATAFVVTPSGLLVAGGGAVFAVTPSGSRQTVRDAAPGVTALARLEDGALALGHDEGRIVVWPTAGGEPVTLAETPPVAPVTITVAGPGLLAAGFRNGMVGVWLWPSGRRLDARWLSGAVWTLERRGHELVALSENGWLHRWNLDVFGIDRCALVERIRREAPAVWRGRPVVEEGPAGDCPAGQGTLAGRAVTPGGAAEGRTPPR